LILCRGRGREDWIGGADRFLWSQRSIPVAAPPRVLGRKTFLRRRRPRIRPLLVKQFARRLRRKGSAAGEGCGRDLLAPDESGKSVAYSRRAGYRRLPRIATAKKVEPGRSDKEMRYLAVATTSRYPPQHSVLSTHARGIRSWLFLRLEDFWPQDCATQRNACANPFTQDSPLKTDCATARKSAQKRSLELRISCSTTELRRHVFPDVLPSGTLWYDEAKPIGYATRS